MFPRQPAGSDRRLYERLVDLKNLFGTADPTNTLIQTPGPALAESLPFHPFAKEATDTEVDPTPLLLAALGTTETELLLLFGLLNDQIPFNDRGDCTLDRRRLSLLYRHVRLARALNLSIADLVQVLQLLSPTRPALTSLDQIEDLLTYASWLKKSPFSTADLRFILAGVETGAASYTNTISTVAQLVQTVQTTAAQPVQAVQTTTADKPGDPAFGAGGALPAALAALFNLTVPRMVDTLAWTSYTANQAQLRTAIGAKFTKGQPDTPAELQPMLDLVHQIERVNVVFSKLMLDDRAVGYLTHHPDSLAINDPTQLTRGDIQSLHTYSGLVTADQRAHLETVLDSYRQAHTLSGPDRALLAAAWTVDESLIGSLADTNTLPASPVAALAALHDRLVLCTTLGVNGYSLAKLGDDSSYQAVCAARDVAVGAVKAKHPDPTALADVVAPFQDRINAAKRDALCGYMLASHELRLRDHNEIYDLLLLDVDMGGCARTSRIVAAISSAQLYVQRCLLNLEQSDGPCVDPSSIPADEWAWRRNFRVWEANRKVFLYPESYLDPDLLDTKTPLLSDLEDDLLQQRITKDSAETAYLRYLTEFAGLAHLRIAGTFFRHEKSTYYFFGRTQSDPPVYYWRTWDAVTWSPWQKMDVAIDAPAVSAEYHRGHLYVFWVDSKTKEKTTITGGTSKTDSVEVNVSLLYSVLSNGKWGPPQRLDNLYPPWPEQDNATSEEAVWQEIRRYQNSAM